MMGTYAAYRQQTDDASPRLHAIHVEHPALSDRHALLQVPPQVRHRHLALRRDGPRPPRARALRDDARERAAHACDTAGQGEGEGGADGWQWAEEEAC